MGILVLSFLIMAPSAQVLDEWITESDVNSRLAPWSLKLPPFQSYLFFLPSEMESNMGSQETNDVIQITTSRHPPAEFKTNAASI